MLNRHLGLGASGEVWAATHDSGEAVALKLLGARVSRGGLAREADAAGRLDHPNLVHLWHVGETAPGDPACRDGRVAPGRPWLAFELLSGGTLDDAAPALVWDGVRAALEDVLVGLAHAHAQGVVHRDLKPANVLRAGPGGRWVVADFGIAAVDGARLPGVSGTPGFMAPEQWAGDWRRQGPHTDLYAVGALAWTLVCGEPPISAVFRPRIAVPDGLAGWMAALLVHDPAERPDVAADVLSALRSLGPPTRPAEVVASVVSGRDSSTVDTEGWDEPVDDKGPMPMAAPMAIPVVVPVRPVAAPRPVPPGALGLALVGRRPTAAPDIPGANERAWALLGRGGPALIVVRGEARTGRSAWMDALAVSWRQAGAARCLDLRPGAPAPRRQIARAAEREVPPAVWVALGADSPTSRRPAAAWLVAHLARERPVLVLAAPEDTAAWWAMRADLGAVVMVCAAEPDRPMPDADLEVVLERAPHATVQAALRAVLPLEADAVAWLVSHADGYPGRAMLHLEELARAGRLVPGRTGHALLVGDEEHVLVPLASQVLALGGDRPDPAAAARVAARLGLPHDHGAWLVAHGLARFEGDGVVFVDLAARRALVGDDPRVADIARAWEAEATSGDPVWAAELVLWGGPPERVAAVVDRALNGRRADVSGAVALLGLLEQRATLPEHHALATAWRADMAVEDGDLLRAEALLEGVAIGLDHPVVRARFAVVRAQLVQARGGDPLPRIDEAQRAFAVAGDAAAVEGCQLWRAERAMASDPVEARRQLDVLRSEATDARIRAAASRRWILLSVGVDVSVEVALVGAREALAAAYGRGDLLEAMQLLNTLSTLHRVAGDERARRDVLAAGCELAVGVPAVRAVFALNLAIAQLDARDVDAATAGFQLAGRLSTRADLSRLAAFGRACAALRGGASERLPDPLPEGSTAVGIALSVWDVLQGADAARVRALMERARPAVSDPELAARIDRALSG